MALWLKQAPQSQRPLRKVSFLLKQNQFVFSQTSGEPSFKFPGTQALPFCGSMSILAELCICEENHIGGFEQSSLKVAHSASAFCPQSVDET